MIWRISILTTTPLAKKIVSVFWGQVHRATLITSATLSVILLSGCASAPPPAARTQSTADNFTLSTDRDLAQNLARDLLAALEPNARIAIQPYRNEDVPIPLTLAQSINDALARAIETAPGKHSVIVAREELPRLFAEAQEFGESNEVQRLLKEARADVLLVGALVPAQGGVQISYKALDVRTGQQLASTLPRFQAVDVTIPNGQPLDQALAAAADALVRQAPDMRTIETLGIYYQQSDVQTPLGGYIARELTGRLTQRIAGFKATPAILNPDLSKAALPRAGVYFLSGTLWDLGKDVDVRLSLQGDGDRMISYGVRIRRDALPNGMLPLAPSADAGQRDVRSPLGLQLSSDRGPRPVYAVGDSAHLIVQTGRDGYLYCFHKASNSAGGAITKIFPNTYHPSALVSGDKSVRIPDDDMKFSLRVYGPAGVEQVRCYVADRDIGPRLPSGFASAALQPVSVSSLEDLGRIFRATSASNVSEATLVMTIEDGARVQ